MPDDTPLFDRVLLTNDDGIDAPGLAVLEQVAATLAREVWVVAPQQDQSGTSHCISLHAPLRLSEKGHRRYAVDGTPGDCVVMGVRHLLRDAPPDMILSGINRGANLGVETVFSGTVGAAMTGMLLGIPAIALSQGFTSPDPVPWETGRALAPATIRALAGLDWSGSACLNVNFPACDAAAAGPLTVTRQGDGLLDGIDVVAGLDPRNLAYHWLRPRRAARGDHADSESAVMLSGRISVTPLRFERTHEQTFLALQAALSG